MSQNGDSIEIIDKPKAKRGRRSKKEIELANALLASKETNNNSNSNINIVYNITENSDQSTITTTTELSTELLEQVQNENGEKPPPKKRGRKPKGGKIVQPNNSIVPKKEEKPNVILHLKCSIKDLLNSIEYNINNNNINNISNNEIESFAFTSSKNELSYEIIENPDNIKFQNKIYDDNKTETTQKFYMNNNNNNNNNNNKYSTDDIGICDTKEIWRKLKLLEQNLHINNISDKKSACFWCSYDFDNPSIYIPKYHFKDSYHVYGCFCTPECSVAYLMNENIDSSTKFERYHLLNHIYAKIYDYKKNIKPAPDPHYMLDKYYGNLTIQEYRSILSSERLFLIVDKPLTRILPEFHEDNDEFIINNKIIPSNNYSVKKKVISKKSNTKSSILNETFGITNE